MPTPRHVGHPGRGRLPDVRPLDRLSTIKIKLGVLVAASVVVAAFITWLGLYNHLGPTRTLPLAVVVALLAVQVLARGMTSPLREMTAAARAMAGGDYSQRVRATSRDEVGQLAEAFNTMARDLEHVDVLRREMVANVSHELRTPVTALRAQLENMVDGVSEPDPEALQAALTQTERLGRLVAYLLDLSRIEAGAVGLDVDDVPLEDFLRDAVAAAEPLAAEKQLRLETVVHPAGLTVPADAERLHQVVANLLHNAVRHSPVGGRITVAAGRSGGSVVIDVADEGPGIPRGDREQVFVRFSRGNAPAQTGSESTGGTGLGLAIVRWAVQLHGGTVHVADSAKGCVMRVTLPAKRQPTPR
ncbi:MULTISPECIES: HAMP domain-containing sensor histidine kinase [unclassified Actinotalea]|uniref:HAMP domain-containing sensor histidine kinase n=1 Tax=unclassified Actinotalea TaxID=2638618 RepID=UPI0015F74819|nr:MULTISPECIES: HAMP domain-containing sensor histidine kinase [unclassified Actinotalea]